MWFETSPQIEPRRGEDPVEGWHGWLAGTRLVGGDRGLHSPGALGQLGLGQPGPSPGVEDQRPSDCSEHIGIHPATISHIAYEPASRKNDVIDAAAAASVAALQGDATRVSAEDETTAFAMLEERRSNVAAQRVRLTNQLHALLRDLIPGGTPLALTAKAAATILRSVRPASLPERTRKELAQDLVRDLRAVDTSLTEIEKRMSDALDERGTRLRSVDGVGSITAARLIGRTGRASRFRSADAFATYTGVAPVEVASGERQRHRLSRSGDRQLNSAIHLVAVTQVRMRDSAGRRYFDTKIAEGKIRNEAMRCLKRRLAAHLWRLMITDERQSQTNPQPGEIAA